jgi:hypothetical protein
MSKWPVSFAIVATLVVTSCAATPAHVATEAPSRVFLLYQTAYKVLDPMSHEVHHDDFARVEKLIINREVDCEIAILKRSASNQELSAMIDLWSTSEKMSKADAISKYGDATYNSAIKQYVLATTTCMEQTVSLIDKLQSVIKESN